MISMDEQSLFQHTKVKIPCVKCGLMIEANSMNMCPDCMRKNVSIGEGIEPNAPIIYCKTCGRYQITNSQWANYELESPELMSLCLKKIAGLKGIKVIEAHFLWTEPHSKRIRISLTIEKEEFHGTILRQTVVLSFIIQYAQCPNCCELATPRDHWKAIVQLRQKSADHRTVFWAEQQILTHRTQNECCAIERKKAGLDFQFNDKASAERFVSFIKSILPLEVLSSGKVAGEDKQCGTFDTRYSYSAKIPPVNRQDLILLPPHLFEASGNRSKFMIVHKMGKSITLVDPLHGNTLKVDSKNFWSHPFDPCLSHSRLKRFIVLSMEPISSSQSQSKPSSKTQSKTPNQSQNQSKAKTNVNPISVANQGKGNQKQSRSKKKSRREMKAEKQFEELESSQNTSTTENVENENQEMETKEENLDIQAEKIPSKISLAKNQFEMVEVELTDEKTYSDRSIVISHLGKILKVGEPCFAYDLREEIISEEATDALGKLDFNGIFIVGRAPQLKKKKRNWKLKTLAPEPIEDPAFDQFLNDIEDDQELRQDIAILSTDENPEENTKENPEENTKENPEENTKENPEENTKENPEGNTKENIKDESSNTVSKEEEEVEENKEE